MASVHYYLIGITKEAGKTWISSEPLEKVIQRFGKRMTKKDLASLLLEALADLEHRQWQHWSKIKNPDHPLNHVAYSQLTFEQKEMDREWAWKVIDIIIKNLRY